MERINSTIKPGLLVSLSTEIKGNVSYRKETIAAPARDAEGIEREKWETEKTIISPEEYERAKKVRSKVTSLLRSVCTVSKHGLLCPQGSESELDVAIDSVRQLLRQFNNSANFSQVNAYIFTATIRDSDQETVRAINAEVSGLLEAMKDGVKALDPEAIRKACNTAKQLRDVLTPEASQQVRDAIDIARKAATEIKQAGEQAAGVIDQATLDQLTDAQTVFLDMEETESVKDAILNDGAAVDLPAEVDSAAIDQAYADQAAVTEIELE